MRAIKSAELPAPSNERSSYLCVDVSHVPDNNMRLFVAYDPGKQELPNDETRRRLLVNRSTPGLTTLSVYTFWKACARDTSAKKYSEKVSPKREKSSYRVSVRWGGWSGMNAFRHSWNSCLQSSLLYRTFKRRATLNL